MLWKVRSEKPLYTDEWLNIRLAEVELPDGTNLSHRIIRTPAGAGATVVNDENSVLMIWRHRFITDSWGWEIPIGRVEAGESPIDAAAREVEEETGWRPGPLRKLLYTQPTNGISDAAHHIFRADTATHLGPPSEKWEADRVEWVPLADIPSLIASRSIVSGTTLAALLYLMVAG
ncbi:NUDIX hydrolase [Sinosporangium siamense]|uniref:NUDIX hydrolase n=1 Tax=Sinosporangium siamense TaxID=1367973 RepID=A0A919RJA8_9ACTN|nr:NUDIX hydrolase [Sinosporangium siamense]GII92934.1 NUDIX hydrolase [Sinosporangium siamense]